MTISEIIGACARRWYVLLVVLALTAVVGVREYRSALPVYTVTSSVIILPSPSLVAARLPTSGTGGITSNPFTSVSTGATLGVVIADALNKASVQDEVLAGGTGAAGASWNYQQSQIIALTTVSSDPDSASGLMNQLVAGVNTIAHEIQLDAGAPADQLYDTVQGAPPGYPEVSYPDRLRTVVGLGLAGLVVGLLVALLLDRTAVALSRRGNRRRHQAAVAPDDEHAAGS